MLLFFFYILTVWSLAFTAAGGQSNSTTQSATQSASNGAGETAGAVAQSLSSTDLVRRALASNAELAAARLEMDKARARLQQAGLRPNPTLDIEQQAGQPVGSPGERATSVGFSLPLEVGGQRRRRIDLAQAELSAAEAEIADRERRLAAEVRAVYAEALAAARELEITEGLNKLDAEAVRVVEARVSEGDAAPLEAHLLRVEVERLRSRRALIEGRLQATLFKLKGLAGIPLDEPLGVSQELEQPSALDSPGGIVGLEAAIEIALRTRPDLRLARLTEEAAQAGLRLAKAQAAPQVAVTARYSTERTITTLPAPFVSVPDSGKALSVGVSIGLPIFNRNQGGQAEAAVVIAQAQRRREFIEAVVRAEVGSALARYHASQSALATFEQGVIARSNDNIRAIRAAYEVGAFRVTDLIAEQRRLVDAQREYTEALTERWRALSDLQSAIGVIEQK